MARSPIAERLTAQALSGPPLRRPEEVAERLLAVQGQDPRGALLAIRARGAALCADDIDRALSPEAVERGVKTIERALAEEGPLTRPQLRERLDSAGVPTAGQALVHLFFRTAILGITVRGPMVGKEHAYVLVRDWLGPQPSIDRDVAWPRWRGVTWPATARRRTATSSAGRACRCATPARAWRRSSRSWSSGRTGSSTSSSAPPAEPLPAPWLLGAFDPLMLGWASREEIVGPHKMLVTNNGLFRPFALVGGRAVSTWRFKIGEMTIEHLGKVSKKAESVLEADARAVEEFMAPR